MTPSRAQLKTGRSNKMGAQVALGPDQDLDDEKRALRFQDIVHHLDNIELSKPIVSPQILLVGSTFEANRTVLSAISGIPFPTKDGLRSPFPTELVLKHAEQTELHVTAQNQPVDAFFKVGFSKESLPDIIDEVKGRMRRSMADKTANQVLRVEIAGPGFPELTLVDLPSLSLFEAEDQKGTSNWIAKSLSEKYLRQSDNIILAIISAEDISTWATTVLNEVKEYDPKGTRTLGIMIKIEKTDDSTPDSWALRTAQNRNSSHNLALGWHVLPTNPDTESTSAIESQADGDAKLFSQGRWSVIQPANRGSENLHARLNNLLMQNIRQKVPGIVTEINQLITQHKSRLAAAGDYRKYLNRIVSSYHKLAHDALQGNYADPFFGKLYSDLSASSYEDRRVKKFRALVKDLNRAFSHVMSTKGHRRRIIWESEDDYDDDENDGQKTPQASNHLAPLVELYNAERPDPVFLEELEDELETVAPEHEGTGFASSVQDTLALRLLRDQIQPWETIANRHIELTTHFAHRFVEKLVLHAVGCDTNAGGTLVKDYVDPYFEKKSAELRAKLDELLHHYHHGYDLQPLYGGQAELGDDAGDALDTGEGGIELLGATAHSDNSSFSEHNHTRGVGASKIIKSMEEYYENALRVFIDNVAVLAVENCLVRDIPSILSLDTVSDMIDKDLQKLAAESRDKLKGNLDRLEKALAACQGLRPQRSTGISRDLPLLRPPSVVSRTHIPRSTRASPSPAPSATVSGPPTPTPSAPEPAPSQAPPGATASPKAATDTAQPNSKPSGTTRPPKVNIPAPAAYAHMNSFGATTTAPLPKVNNPVPAAPAATSTDRFGGSTTAPSPFGSTKSPSGLFGDSGTSAAAARSLFGDPKFGAHRASPATGTGGSSGFGGAAFGQSATSTASGTGGSSSFGGGAFGKPATSTASGTGGSPGFGQPVTGTGGGLFGAARPSTTTTATGGLFGSTVPVSSATSSTVPTSSGGSLFGSRTSATSGPTSTTTGTTTGSGGLFQNLNKPEKPYGSGLFSGTP
ncbi:hypothetical protein QBC44DRAFT_327648 [Cladorrhinum sp. PSN332]|nr:hypothetical protein QBC44DRAFT_327648 [Cladorrhinum sp. PSN332]